MHGLTWLRRHQEALVQHLKTELRQVEDRHQELENAVHVANQSIGDHEKRGKQMRVEQQRAQENYEALCYELEEETPQDGKLDELHSQLADREAESQTYSTDYENAIIEKDKINAEQAEVKRQLDEVQVQVNGLESKINKAEGKEGKLDDKRRNALLEKNRAFALIDDAKADKQQLERDRTNQEEKVASFNEQALDVSARVPVPENTSADELDRKLGKYYRDLEAYREQQGGTLEELTYAAARARKEWRQAARQLDGLLKTADSLKRSMHQRRNRWIDFRRFISSRARANFHYLLSERAFRGNLKLDHKSKLLDLSVEPDITRASDHGRQTKTLSGGEKSFSTICLLLSIWEAMGSPIRCLDEFDVFMDNVNRDVSMKMMINAARRSVGRQFVLITPQAMGNVDSAEDVRIHKMRDPERGQTTISFGN